MLAALETGFIFLEVLHMLQTHYVKYDENLIGQLFHMPMDQNYNSTIYRSLIQFEPHLKNVSSVPILIHITPISTRSLAQLPSSRTSNEETSV